MFDAKTCIEFDKHCRSMEGRKVEVLVREWRARRSGKQNRYFHGVVLKRLQEKTGYEGPDGLDELKGLLEDKFLRIPCRMGYRVRESESLNTKEFEEFMENIRLWAAVAFEDLDEDGNLKPFIIPLPNEAEEPIGAEYE